MSCEHSAVLRLALFCLSVQRAATEQSCSKAEPPAKLYALLQAGFVPKDSGVRRYNAQQPVRDVEAWGRPRPPETDPWYFPDFMRDPAVRTAEQRAEQRTASTYVIADNSVWDRKGYGNDVEAPSTYDRHGFKWHSYDGRGRPSRESQGPHVITPAVPADIIQSAITSAVETSSMGHLAADATPADIIDETLRKESTGVVTPYYVNETQPPVPMVEPLTQTAVQQADAMRNQTNSTGNNSSGAGAASLDCLLGDWQDWSPCAQREDDAMRSPSRVRTKALRQQQQSGGKPCSEDELRPQVEQCMDGDGTGFGPSSTANGSTATTLMPPVATTPITAPAAAL